MKLIYFNFIIILIYFLIACDDTINENIDNIVIPSQNVSYSQYIQPVFNYKCTNSGCHNSEDRAGGLSLTSWAEARTDPSIIFPGIPESSRLVWSIEPKYGSAFPMPPPNSSVLPLTQNQIDGIITWIKEGAENN